LYTRKGRRHDNRHPNKRLQQAVAGTAKDRDGNSKRQRQKAQVKRQTGTAKDRDRRQKVKKAKVKGGNKREKSNAICMEAGERRRHGTSMSRHQPFSSTSSYPMRSPRRSAIRAL
jgi:hypothetical protein